MSDSPPKPVSALWYLVPFALFALLYFIGTAWAASSYDLTRDATVTVTREPLNAAGKSVAVFTNFVQGSRQIRCTSRTSAHPKPRELTPVRFLLTNEKNDQPWILLATRLKGEKDMRVACAPRDHQPDSAQYGYAVLDGYAERTWAGNIIQIASVIASVIAFVIIFRRRQRSLNT